MKSTNFELLFAALEKPQSKFLKQYFLFHDLKLIDGRLSLFLRNFQISNCLNFIFLLCPDDTTFIWHIKLQTMESLNIIRFFVFHFLDITLKIVATY